MDKRNCVISPFISKKVGTLILILWLMIMIVIFLNSICFSQSPKPAPKKAATPIQVKIPDGLYLYKPYFSERWSGNFSPLILVKNKKLMDPYLVAEEKGYEAYLSKYVVGKTFDVYVGSERFGSLRELDLGFRYSSPCRRDEFIPDMVGNGEYEGKPLPSEWFIEKEMWGNRYKIYGSTRILITPQTYRGPKGQVLLSMTDDDMKRAEEAVRKHLVPGEIEEINKRLAKEKDRVIGESKSRLAVIEAFDLDFNGKKDIVGQYYLSTKTNTRGYWSRGIWFVLWDTGKIEKIKYQYNGGINQIMIGGVVDIDQDGILELIIATGVTSRHEDVGEGRQIDILRHGPLGWTSIYRS
jgi:hypothetical protein